MKIGFEEWVLTPILQKKPPQDALAAVSALALVRSQRVEAVPAVRANARKHARDARSALAHKGEHERFYGMV